MKINEPRLNPPDNFWRILPNAKYYRNSISSFGIIHADRRRDTFVSYPPWKQCIKTIVCAVRELELKYGVGLNENSAQTREQKIAGYESTLLYPLWGRAGLILSVYGNSCIGHYVGVVSLSPSVRLSPVHTYRFPSYDTIVWWPTTRFSSFPKPVLTKLPSA